MEEQGGENMANGSPEGIRNLILELVSIYPLVYC